MKDYQEKYAHIFHNIFGKDFIYRMKSRIDIPVFQSKEILDPDPEIPDDLEISKDSDTINLASGRHSDLIINVLKEDASTQTEREKFLNILHKREESKDKRK
jgi:hypothetical protein